MLASVRNHALYVRGDAHLHQYYLIARGLYGPHDTWFRSNLGFTISEAIQVTDALFTENARRMNDGRRECKKKAEELATQQGYTGSEWEEMKVDLFIRLFFGNSDKVLAFTAGQLADFSGVPLDSCRSILNRLSQEFGYRNPIFPDTFENPDTTPWDYNTMYERPLIRRGDEYWMVLPSIMRTVIATTFYFDLMADSAYRPTFEAARGSWCCSIRTTPMTKRWPMFWSCTIESS
jgi:hypothetical protein